MATRYLVASGTWDGSNTAIWGSASGLVDNASVPTSSDDVTIEGGFTATTSGLVECNACNQTTGTLVVVGNGLTINGDHTVGADATFDGGGTVRQGRLVEFHEDATISFTGRMDFVRSGSVQTFNPGGHQTPFIFNPNGDSGTLKLLGDCITPNGGNVVHVGVTNQASLDTNGFDMTFGSFAFADNNPSTLNMTGSTLTAFGTTGTGWNVQYSNGFTLISTNSTVVLVRNHNTQKTLACDQGLVFNDVYLKNGTGSGIFEIEGGNVFHELRADPVAMEIQFEAGFTQTTALLVLSGAAGAILTLGSKTPGSWWAIAKSGGGSFNIDYVDISDCAPPVGTTIYCGPNSVNGGGNNDRVVFAGVTSVSGAIPETLSVSSGIPVTVAGSGGIPTEIEE